MYLFIMFSIVVIFCFATIIYASNNDNNCDHANVTRKTTPEYSQPTPTQLSPIPKYEQAPTPYPYPYRRSPYLPYDPLYNLYSISPMSSLYTYLVEDHPHGFIERGRYGRGNGHGNVVQNFNTNFSGGHTGGRM